VTRDLNLWPFESKINGFHELIVIHSCVKFSDCSGIGFLDIVWKNKQTDKHTNEGKNTIPATPDGVGKTVLIITLRNFKVKISNRFFLTPPKQQNALLLFSVIEQRDMN